MNTNFNPARVIQTHLSEVPAHPINGAQKTVQRDYPGRTL